MNALLSVSVRMPVGLDTVGQSAMLGGSGSPGPRDTGPECPPPISAAPPPEPEDDESGRGVSRLGPALLVGVLFWVAVVFLLL